MEAIERKNEQIQREIAALKEELAELQQQRCLQQRTMYDAMRNNLLLDVGRAVDQLRSLEREHGKRQIPLPSSLVIETVTDTKPSTSAGGQIEQTSKPKKVEPSSKPPKEPKILKKSTQSVVAADASKEMPIDVGRLDMRIGKIIEVTRHPDAESLYVEKIDCGESNPRTIISGLVKYVPIEEMKNRLVVVLCNLKPAKMRGITSEGMVMCASTSDKVEILNPPPGSVPGDLVYCEGYSRNPDAQLNPKKKIFETCAPDLKTNDNLVACYKAAPFYVPEKGNIVAQTLKSVQVK